MRPSLRSRSLLRSTTRCLPGLALAALAFSASPSAHAHIQLMNPPSWVVEGERGDPQKAGPCGDDGTAAVQKTGTVTTFTAGETITVMWKETVGHPGHFRISLTKPGEDRSVLVDPVVETATGDGKTGDSISAATVSDGTGDVLKDKLFERTDVAANMPQPEPFMQDITLPNEPCEKCTLQVIQFMAKHGPGYFYHHCADIEIVAKSAAVDSGAVGAAGSTSMGTGGSSSTGAGGSGAGTSAAGSSSISEEGEDDGGCTLAGGAQRSTHSGAAVIALFGLAATLWRRRAAR